MASGGWRDGPSCLRATHREDARAPPCMHIISECADLLIAVYGKFHAAGKQQCPGIANVQGNFRNLKFSQPRRFPAEFSGNLDRKSTSGPNGAALLLVPLAPLVRGSRNWTARRLTRTPYLRTHPPGRRMTADEPKLKPNFPNWRKEYSPKGVVAVLPRFLPDERKSSSRAPLLRHGGAQRGASSGFIVKRRP